MANEVKPCACSEWTGAACNALTTKTFAPGHDARMISQLANNPDFDLDTEQPGFREQFGDRLADKLVAAVAKAQAKRDARAERERLAAERRETRQLAASAA